MSIEVNWADVAMGCILLGVIAVACTTYCFLDARRLKAEENRQRRAFERQMAAVELPPWDGQDYEWTPESLAYLDDTHLYAGPGIADTLAFEQVPEAPAPPSPISGPLPVMDDGDFLTRMKAENAAFLKGLDSYAAS